MKQITIAWLSIIVGITLAIFVGIISMKNISMELMNINCCGNAVCSDTYYTPEDNKCHLVLCEHSLLFNKDDCTYDGLNKSIPITSLLQ